MNHEPSPVELFPEILEYVRLHPGARVKTCDDACLRQIGWVVEHGEGAVLVEKAFTYPLTELKRRCIGMPHNLLRDPDDRAQMCKLFEQARPPV